jgi:hypothetical protein
MCFSYWKGLLSANSIARMAAINTATMDRRTALRYGAAKLCHPLEILARPDIEAYEVPKLAPNRPRETGRRAADPREIRRGYFAL